MSALKSDNRLPKIYLEQVGKIIITVNMKQPPLGALVYCKERGKETLILTYPVVCATTLQAVKFYLFAYFKKIYQISYVV